MNKYFEKAIERFEDKFGKALISPISSKDSSIIDILLLEVEKVNKKLSFYLKSNWKYLKDDEVLDEVIGLVAERFDGEREVKERRQQAEEFVDSLFGEDGEKIKYKKDIIEFNGKFYEAFLIFSWERESEIEMDLEIEQHSIVLNKVSVSATKIPLYANEKIIFLDEEERDEKFEEFTNLMEELRFVNLIREF